MYLLLFLGMMLSAYPVIADTSAPATEAAQPAPATEAVQTPRAVLEQRVTAKWDALIRRDFEAAYSFTSPSYRKLYSLNSFRSNFGNKAGWRRIEVVNVDFKGDDAATVGFNLHFVYHPLQAEKPLDMQTYVQESWVRVDGQWWCLVKE